MSSTERNQSPIRRRVLVTAASIAGAGATFSFVALAAPAPSATTSLAPAAVDSAVTAPLSSLLGPVALAPKAAPAAPMAAPVVAPKAAPAAKAAPAPHTMTAPAAAADSCDGLLGAAGTFQQHLDAAHLQLSPTEQVTDALDVDQYTKTHTVMLANMLSPVLSGATDSLGTFLQHLDAAHLELSPTEQVADALDVDQYTKTHTVMAGQMAAPLIGSC